VYRHVAVESQERQSAELCGGGQIPTQQELMWRSLSQQVLLWSGERCGGALVSGDCFTCTGHLATLSIYYDSLIEKCSTLPVEDWHVIFSSKRELGTE
jgi:hypothetical protein